MRLMQFKSIKANSRNLQKLYYNKLCTTGFLINRMENIRIEVQEKKNEQFSKTARRSVQAISVHGRVGEHNKLQYLR